MNIAPSLIISAANLHFLHSVSNKKLYKSRKENYIVFESKKEDKIASFEIFTNPFHQANPIRPTIPVPSFITHVIVAANAVASLSPTPTP